MNEKEKEEYLQYILSRQHNSHKRNYHKECLKEIERFQKENRRSPTVLLHVCCIVCACWPIEFLLQCGCQVTVFYNNPNIYPYEEYVHRLSEVNRYLHERYDNAIEILEGDYTYPEYEKTVLSHRAEDPEGWKSCFACYADRMQTVFTYADSHGFDYFTTVMTFSRQKDSQKINEIGMHLGKQYSHTRYLVSDFKKANGSLHSSEICDSYHLYRQSYCGCRYSRQERSSEM